MKEIHYWQEGYDSSESRPDPLKVPERSGRAAEGIPDHRRARAWERAVGTRLATRKICKRDRGGHSSDKRGCKGRWKNVHKETRGVICWCHLCCDAPQYVRVMQRT